MAQPEQIWNDADLPIGDQTKITRPSDEDLISWDRAQSHGTEAAGLLSRVEESTGRHTLCGDGEKPAGIVIGSERKGYFSNLERGYNICVPRGDLGSTSAENVVAATTDITTDGTLTIADDLDDVALAEQLTVDPNQTPTGTATITIKGLNADGGEIEETLTWSSNHAAQTTDAYFQSVTEISVAGWQSGSTVTITATVTSDPTVNQSIVGATKTIGGVAKKGYAKGHATAGIGRITRVTQTHIYGNLP